MSAATEIRALRAELVETRMQLDELKRALDLMGSERITWSKAKRLAASGVEMPNDVTVGKGLPAAPVRTELNGIGM